MSIVANLKVNGIGGSYYERWNMWFNAIIHVEPYQYVINILLYTSIYIYVYYNILNSTAWLSSVRALKCTVKSF